MTERLYYGDPYLTTFQATVKHQKAHDGFWHVELDRTAFYPLGGGQPSDIGVLNDAMVSDVYADNDGVIWHVCDREVQEGECVNGEIDWARRFDHMQQHAGDHMIAGYVHRLYQGFTVGLHLGQEFSTIDITLPNAKTRFDDAEIAKLEALVNGDIQKNLPIRCFFPDEEEMKSLPLRKDPSVIENVRVVLIGEDECCACGGTHPMFAGEIGVVKILWTAPSRGKLRLAFIAGMRAIRDYQARFNASERAAHLLSTKPEGIGDAAQALLDRERMLSLELFNEKKNRALSQVSALANAASELIEGWRLVAYEDEELDIESMKMLAKALIEGDKFAVLLGNGSQLLFARSAEADAPDALDMGALLRDTTQTHGGKGGGRPDFAQGVAAESGALGYAKEKLTSKA